LNSGIEKEIRDRARMSPAGTISRLHDELQEEMRLGRSDDLAHAYFFRAQQGAGRGQVHEFIQAITRINRAMIINILTDSIPAFVPSAL